MATAAWAQPRQPAAPSCAAAEFHQLDFLAGEWEVREKGKVIATNRWRPAVQGCVLIEEWVDSKGEPANSMFFYDAAAKKWTWLSVATGGVLEAEGVDRAFRGTGMEWRFKPESKDRFALEERNTKTKKLRTLEFARGKYQAEKMTQRCKGTEHRQFDFWLGDWQVYVNGQRGGANRIAATPSGCVNVENWVARGLSPGLSFNFYDGGKKQWRQVWVAPGGVLRLAGTFDGATLRYEGRTGATLERLSFTPNADGTVRQFWQQSADEGKTWTVAFDGVYRKEPVPGREVLLARLREAEKRTRAEIEKLTEEQANSRPSEKAWSVREIVDHLTVSERLAATQVKEMIERPGWVSESAFATPTIDAQLEGVMLNRAARRMAPEVVRPQQPNATWAEVRDGYFAQRSEMLRIVEEAKVDLRSVRRVHLVGQLNLDAHQWVLVAALHNLRHLEQIVETRRAIRAVRVEGQ